MDSNHVVVNALGNRLWVNPEDQRGRAMMATAGNVNPLSMVLWSHALGLHLWDTVVDVGANYGEMIVGAPIAPSTRVIAFEPNRDILPYLTKTCAESTLDIELLPLAVSDFTATKAEFYRNQRWSGMSGLEPEQDSTLVLDQVEVTTLDAFFAERIPGSACIKIDVEGADVAVLDGARETLSKIASWAVMIEILHLTIEQVVELAVTRNLYLIDQRTQALVRVSSSDPVVVDRMLHSGWLYAQDALLTSVSISSTDVVAPSVDELLIDATLAVEARDREIQVLHNELAAVRNSRSWAVTAPMRWAGDFRAKLARRISRRGAE